MNWIPYVNKGEIFIFLGVKASTRLLILVDNQLVGSLIFNKNRNNCIKFIFLILPPWLQHLTTLMAKNTASKG